MKFRCVQKMLSLLMSLCMMMSLSGAMAQSDGEFDALLPLMDLVCAASLISPSAPENVPGEGEQLTSTFAGTLFQLASFNGAELQMDASVTEDTSKQAAWLQSVFAAGVPELQEVGSVIAEKYIGFHPVTINNLNDGTVQIIGEMYQASKALRQMTDEEFVSVDWLDRAVFTFRSDASAMNGFRLAGFSVGTDLSAEEIFMDYDAEIAVEYESKLGFTVLYPAVFEDELLVEDDNGVSAELTDGSASFFARRTANENGAALADYVSVVASAIPGSVTAVYEEMQYATVAYVTDDGYSVFEVYTLTEDYVFEAQLRYLTTLANDFTMYNAYLENSFVVNELSQG